jgi:hypothetical protein
MALSAFVQVMAPRAPLQRLRRLPAELLADEMLPPRLAYGIFVHFPPSVSCTGSVQDPAERAIKLRGLALSCYLASSEQELGRTTTWRSRGPVINIRV